MSNIKDIDVSDVQQELCASCGKEGNSDDMNTCNKCKTVKYCNAACKKKHRKKHKKACERRVAELHDEKLFKEHPPNEECPLCFLPMPFEYEAIVFSSCCGKTICLGCVIAMKMSEGGADLCAYCRKPLAISDHELCINETKELMEKEYALAFATLAGHYSAGELGLPQDYQKANELYLKAGELGCADGYYNLGNSYYNGYGVEVDKKKAKYYYELAAIGGDVKARHNLGIMEGNDGNYERASKHFIIGARAGYERSLENVKIGFMSGLGLVTKDEYADTLRAYHERQKEMRSDARDKAAQIRARIG